MQGHSFPTTWQSQSGSWRRINPQLHFTHSRLRAQPTPPLQNTNMNTNTTLALERNQTANKVLSLSSSLNYIWRSSFLHLLDLCKISGTQLCFQRWDSKEVQGEIHNKKTMVTRVVMRISISSALNFGQKFKSRRITGWEEREQKGAVQ